MDHPDPLFPLLLLLRYMHILGAIALMGGAIFMRFALAPTVITLEGSTRAEVHERVRARWSKFVMAAAGLLLVSGLANMMLYSSRRYDMSPVPIVNASYAMFVGIKFLLALPIFLFASFLAGKSATAKKFQEKAVFWMNVNLTLALVMVLMGGLLKFVQREYKEQPAAPQAASAALLP
ncbi:MAG TPA: hypothetical protein VFV87_15725 [Pirellulaceae bacterium]|nr:hypothetical protein [Pirellulaceae bacterium]